MIEKCKCSAETRPDANREWSYAVGEGSTSDKTEPTNV